MDNEELVELTIKKSKDLNEEAEYAGSKQDLEQKLLEAQRYLNIFHQIHIFNDKKKAEFDQALIDMPEDVRKVLMNLPGGRVLIEHIEDVEIKRGLREERTVFAERDVNNQMERESKKSSEMNKEFAKAIQNAMETYNQNLLQLNERMLQSNKQMAENSKNNSNNQSKLIADVLRENNKQQMEMMKTLGSTLSNAIISSQKEMFSAAEKVVKNMPKTDAKNVNPSVATNRVQKVLVGGNSGEIFAKKNVSQSAPKKENIDVNDIKVLHKFGNATEKDKKKEPEDEIKLSFSGNKKTEDNAETKITDNKPSIVSDIDIADLLGGDKEEDDIRNAFAKPQNAPVEAEKISLDEPKYTQSKEAKTSAESNPTQTFGSAMQKIKEAITETAASSLDKIKEVPVSLSGSKDDITASFAKAFSPKKETPKEEAPKEETPADEEEWEYVDENGNPVNPEEWEYVDENGNPVNPEEWEYVDENGNPVNPEEWEYVDENGNPIK